jgi:hypothetical protein
MLGRRVASRRHVRTADGSRRYELPIGSFVKRTAPRADGGVWFRVRYVRTAAGARRYGVPIGSPIPVGRKVRNRTMPNGATRLRLTPAQRALAGRVFGEGSGSNGASHEGGTSLDVDNPTAAARALDKSLAGDDLTPGQRRTARTLRDKIAGLTGPANDGTSEDTPRSAPLDRSETPSSGDAPGPASEPADDGGPLPTVDEAEVERKASAIEAAVASTLGTTQTLDDFEGNGGFDDALSDAVAEQFPDATADDRTELERAITRSVAEQFGPQDGAPQPGRGTRLAVRALERKNAARGKDVRAAMAAAREVIGDPRQFGRNADGGQDIAADGGPGPDTMRKLQAVRDAGAVLSAEVDRRVSADREQTEAEAAADLERFVAEQRDYRGRSLAFQDEVAAALTQRFGDADEDLVDDLVNALVLDPVARPGDDQQNGFLDQYRFRAGQLADEREDMRQSYTQRLVSRAAAARSEADIRREVLAEQRPMGGVAMRYRMGDGADGQEERVREMLAVAEGSYPKDWLRRANAYGGSQGMLITHGADRAGYYPDRNQLETGVYADQALQESAVIHELGHAMESSSRHLMAAQWAFLSDRTSRGGDPGTRQFDDTSRIYGDDLPDEIGYKDDFRQHYTGRTYDGGGATQNHEVLTTGMEDLMSGAPTRSLDSDLEQFMLGMLGVL